MTVSSEVMKTRFTGDGSTKTFSVPWKIQSANGLGIYLINVSTSPPTYAEVTSNYSVSPTDGSYPSLGATITYPVTGSAISSSYELLIGRKVDLVQAVTFRFGGTYNPTYMEKVLDAVVMEIQQVNELASRSLRVPVATDTDAISPLLPYPVADEMLAWNSTGTALTTVNMQAKVDAASASAASTSSSASSAASSASAAAASLASMTSELDSAVATATAAANASATSAAASLASMTSQLDEAVANATAEAAGSASSAASYMENAETSATAASASATAAAASATAASSSATLAENSAEEASVAAASSADSAVTAAAYAAPAWSVSTTYNYPDAVTYTDGYAYRCVGTSVLGDIPSQSSNWVQILTSIENFWKYDTDGDVTMNAAGTYSNSWYRDGNGDISMKA